jgi:hypothetical protein
MEHRFTYPPDLLDKMRREQRRRWGLWAALVLIFAAAGLTVERRGWIVPAVVVGFALMLSFFEYLLGRFARATARVAGNVLEVRGNLVRQLDREGRVLGEVDLCDPFKVTYPYYAVGNAFYTVRGPSGQIEFSSRIDGGETLVREVLRQHEWPPGANAT